MSGDSDPVFSAEQVFKENAKRIGEAGDVDTGLAQGSETEDLVGASADTKRGPRAESVCHGGNIRLEGIPGRQSAWCHNSGKISDSGQAGPMILQSCFDWMFVASIIPPRS